PSGFRIRERGGQEAARARSNGPSVLVIPRMTQSPCEMREPSLQPLRTILKRRRRCPEFLEQRRCILPTLFTGADLLNRALVQHCAVGEEVHGSRFSSPEEGRRSRLVADPKMSAMNDRSIHPGPRN